MSALGGKLDEKEHAEAVALRPPVPVQYELLQDLQRHQRLLDLCVRSFIVVEELVSLCEQLDDTFDRARGGRNRQALRDAETQLESITPLAEIRGLADVDESFPDAVGRFDEAREATLRTLRSMMRPGVAEGVDITASLTLIDDGVAVLKDKSRRIAEACKTNAQAELGEISSLLVGIIKVAEALEAASGVRVDHAMSGRPATSEPAAGLQELRPVATDAPPEVSSDRQTSSTAPPAQLSTDRKLTLG